MVEPISTSAAAIMALAQAAQGGAQYAGSRAQAAAERKKAKEQKRKTFADLLNDALNREHDTSKDTRHTQAEMSGARAKAMQEMAAGIRQSLRG
jgi:flagellar hook-basal body complex protein FliE